MKKLRTLHLYLGCVFGPMILFFAASGIWQTFGLHFGKATEMLSTIHIGRGYKSNAVPNLSSPFMQLFVVAMAAGLILTTLLGIIMALKYGQNRRAAIFCLAFGCLFPLLLVAVKLLS